MSQHTSRHYCIFRTDGIGDVIVTLPMAEAIKKHEPNARVTFCVQKVVEEIVRLSPSIDDVFAIDSRDILSISEFAQRLTSLSVDVALFAYPRPRIARAALRAHIPVRVGTSSRWYSILFNRRIYEHRSDAAFHESVYNLHMLDVLQMKYDFNLKPTLTISDEIRNDAKKILHDIGIDLTKPFVILHPGSGGSAKEWSAKNFGALGQRIVESHPEISILITGTKNEHSLMNIVQSCIDRNVFSLNHSISLENLSAILSMAQCIVANSTGPLHIGAAVGIPVVGLFPNKKVCNPRRWKPLSDHAFIFTPPVDAHCKRCLHESCNEHDNMDRIEIENVFGTVRDILQETSCASYA